MTLTIHHPQQRTVPRPSHLAAVAIAVASLVGVGAYTITQADDTPLQPPTTGQSAVVPTPELANPPAVGGRSVVVPTPEQASTPAPAETIDTTYPGRPTDLDRLAEFAERNGYTDPASGSADIAPVPEGLPSMPVALSAEQLVRWLEENGFTDVGDANRAIRSARR